MAYRASRPPNSVQGGASCGSRAKEHTPNVQAEAGPLFSDWTITYTGWHAKRYPDSYFRVEQILRSHLEPEFGPLPLMGINRQVVEASLDRRLKEAVAGTVVKEFRTLQATLNAAVKWDVISRNPIANVEAPRDFTSRPPRWFTREELARIYAIELEIPKFTTPSDAELHRRMRCSWQLIANTGMRRAEALPLQWRDIGAEEIGIRSEQDARTKSGKWRAIPISRVARESLEELHADETYVIPQMAPASVS